MLIGNVSQENSNKGGKSKVQNLIKCNNTTCRECVEKTLVQCKTLSSWNACATCATWKCKQCRSLTGSSDTAKTEYVSFCVYVSFCLRGCFVLYRTTTVRQSERRLPTGSGKEAFSATLKSLQTCKNFSCRADSMLDYKLKKQCGKVSWRMGLTSKEKKRQKSDMKEFYQASHELKKLRKQK
jgi:hypothetical protein